VDLLVGDVSIFLEEEEVVLDGLVALEAGLIMKLGTPPPEPDGICGAGKEMGGLDTGGGPFEGLRSGMGPTDRRRTDDASDVGPGGGRPRLLDLCTPACESGGKRLSLEEMDMPGYGGGERFR